MNQQQIDTTCVLEELDRDIRALILRYLQRPTTSQSSFKNIPTGNAYQTIQLRTEVVPGFRNLDFNLFAGIPIAGRSFVDLACNFGEKTRLAINNGASVAVGIEYDEFFVRIANLISLYNNARNITINLGDVTAPSCLHRDFDIAGCFSAWVYVRERIAEIAPRIIDLFLLETHALDKGWINSYIDELSTHFPYWIIYGFSEHGAHLSERRRAYVAFSRDDALITAIPILRTSVLDQHAKDLISISINDSPRITSICGERRATRDLFQTCRAEFKVHPATDELDALADRIQHFGSEIGTFITDKSLHTFGSDYYWHKNFLGFAKFMRDLTIAFDNEYLKYILDLSKSGQYDPAMEGLLSNENVAVQRIQSRFGDTLGIMRQDRWISPITVLNALNCNVLEQLGISIDNREPWEYVIDKSGIKYWPPLIDGHHRVVAYYLSGADACSAAFMWTNAFLLDVTSKIIKSEGHHPNSFGVNSDTLKTALEITMAGLFN